jgi:hypothetical protein
MAVALAFFLVVPTSAQSGTGRLSMNPETPQAGQEIDVEVLVEDVSNVAAFQATLTWDPAALTFVQGRLGAFLETSERNVTFVPPFGEPGRLTFAAYSVSAEPRPGASGSGVLFGLRLRTRRAGPVNINIEELLLADSANEPIPLALDTPLLFEVTQAPTIYLPVNLASASLP